MRKPGVMVSSTCYDLGQVRADLRSFIDEQLGYLKPAVRTPLVPRRSVDHGNRELSPELSATLAIA